jgi:FAD:protein FMN transferase
MIVLRQRLLSTLVCLALFDCLSSAAPARRYEFAEIHMGTQFRIILYSANEKLARHAAQKAFHRIARLDATMSDYKETSELNRFCRKAAKNPVTISADLFRILSHSQRLAKRSEGAFDVTVGVVVRLWRRARRTGTLPEAQRLAQALALTGYEKLHLDARSRGAWLEEEGMLLDLGGIAKGFAADEAMRVLRQLGIRSALVAAGGDIVVSDAPPQKNGWLVAVAALPGEGKAGQIDASVAAGDAGARPAAAGQVANLWLSNAAVSTSGDAEQFVEIDGVRYSHIVDPRTGVGVKGQSSVTVVARRGRDSDGLATAVSVLGPERGLRLIEATPGAAALMIRKTAGGLALIESKRWQGLRKSSKVTAQK